MRDTTGLFLVMALLSACSTRGGGTDRPGFDGGTAHDGAPTDSAPGLDSGAHPDGAPSDGGPATDSGPGTDGGSVDAAVSCMAMLASLPAAAVPRCTAATHACIDGCIADAGTGSPVTCVVACEHADTTAPYTADGMHIDCAGCLNYEQRHCIDASGCHDAVAALDCCVAAHCPDGSCVASTCMTQYSAYATCAMATAAPCVSMPTAFPVAHCFADVTVAP